MQPKYLESLNPQQLNAVLAIEGPVIILAGAGSGKTRVLTLRSAYLILEKKVPARNILMVTFTNKAAKEMKTRITSIIKSVNLPFAGTFHSLSAKILKVDGYQTGISKYFSIYDESDQLEAIKQVMTSLNVDLKSFHPKSIASAISQAKNELIAPAEYLNISRGYFHETAAKIYIGYQDLLKKNQALDFDDLLFETVKLLKKVESVRRKWQDTFRYVLVDEYHDTNKAQYELTKLLGGKFRNICIVGDASQSIYSFRGADFRNIMNFKTDFTDVKTFYLEQNYRSSKTILQAAGNVIVKNTSHPVLQLWTNNTKGENIILYTARTEQDEALFIVNKINEFLLDSKYNMTFKDFAVLYRTNAQSRVVEEAFLHHLVPYILIGGVRFYERKEIKDLLSYLKYIYNSQDSVSHARIIKIGKNRMKKYLQLVSQLKEIKPLTTLETLDRITTETGYLDLYDKNIEEDRLRLENIKELRSVAAQFPTLSEFLENVALIEKESIGQNKKNNTVSLLTVHTAKGLEFRVVFIIGLEEGLFPHSQSLMERSEIEEERRLCYVAITRAKEFLFLTHAKRRLFFGKSMQNMPSRFLMDIGEHLLNQQYASFLD